MGDHNGQIISAIATWPMIINGFGICYVKGVCVVPLSQPSSRDLVYPLWDVPT